MCQTKKKRSWKCDLQNCSHFVQVSVCKRWTICFTWLDNTRLFPVLCSCTAPVSPFSCTCPTAVRMRLWCVELAVQQCILSPLRVAIAVCTALRIAQDFSEYSRIPLIKWLSTSPSPLCVFDLFCFVGCLGTWEGGKLISIPTQNTIEESKRCDKHLTVVNPMA